MGEQTGRATAPTPAPVIVVAIGASAGGLDALKAFFAAVSPDPRIVFVVVTHLPARRASHLAELLDASGPVRVTQAVDGERLEPGRAYFAPPGVLVRLSGETLALERTDGRPGLPKPTRSRPGPAHRRRAGRRRNNARRRHWCQ